MKRHTDKPIRHRRTRGLSLVELLVAITVGSILMVGLIEIFISNKQAYRIQDNLGILQENGRTAMERISQSIRMTDHWGGVEGADVSNTLSSGDIVGIGNCNQAWMADAASGIRGYEGAGALSGVSFPTGCISATEYVPNSDILVLRYANGSEFVADADLSSTANTGRLFVRSAFDNAGLFLRYDDTIPTALPAQMGTYNFPYVIEVYYLRACSQKSGGSCDDQIPTLTRLTLSNSSGTPTLTEEPLVENIEQLQFQFGRDTNRNNDVDRYDSAGSLAAADWADVVNIRVSLLARADLPDNTHTDSGPYSMLGYTHTPATADQNFHRKQYDRIVQIRNRTRK